MESQDKASASNKSVSEMIKGIEMQTRDPSDTLPSERSDSGSVTENLEEIKHASDEVLCMPTNDKDKDISSTESSNVTAESKSEAALDESRNVSGEKDESLCPLSESSNMSASKEISDTTPVDVGDMSQKEDLSQAKSNEALTGGEKFETTSTESSFSTSPSDDKALCHTDRLASCDNLSQQTSEGGDVLKHTDIASQTLKSGTAGEVSKVESLRSLCVKQKVTECGNLQVDADSVNKEEVTHGNGESISPDKLQTSTRANETAGNESVVTEKSASDVETTGLKNSNYGTAGTTEISSEENVMDEQSSIPTENTCEKNISSKMSEATTKKATYACTVSKDSTDITETVGGNDTKEHSNIAAESENLHLKQEEKVSNEQLPTAKTAVCETVSNETADVGISEAEGTTEISSEENVVNEQSSILTENTCEKNISCKMSEATTKKVTYACTVSKDSTDNTETVGGNDTKEHSNIAAESENLHLKQDAKVTNKQLPTAKTAVCETVSNETADVSISEAEGTTEISSKENVVDEQSSIPTENTCEKNISCKMSEATTKKATYACTVSKDSTDITETVGGNDIKEHSNIASKSENLHLKQDEKVTNEQLPTAKTAVRETVSNETADVSISETEPQREETEDDGERRAFFYISSCSVPGMGEGWEWPTVSSEHHYQRVPPRRESRRNTAEPRNCLGTQRCHYIILAIGVLGAILGCLTYHLQDYGIGPKVLKPIGASAAFLSFVVCAFSSVYLTYLSYYTQPRASYNYQPLGVSDPVASMLIDTVPQRYTSDPRFYFTAAAAATAQQVFRETQSADALDRPGYGWHQSDIKRPIGEPGPSGYDPDLKRFKMDPTTREDHEMKSMRRTSEKDQCKERNLSQASDSSHYALADQAFHFHPHGSGESENGEKVPLLPKK